MHRNYRSENLMFLKLAYLPSKLRFLANICFKNIKLFIHIYMRLFGMNSQEYDQMFKTHFSHLRKNIILRFPVV